jgi:hypothetical protein
VRSEGLIAADSYYAVRVVIHAEGALFLQHNYVPLALIYGLEASPLELLRAAKRIFRGSAVRSVHSTHVILASATCGTS